MSPLIVTSPPTLPMTLPMTLAALLASGVFGAIGLRCLLAPGGGARFFGVPVTDRGGESYVRAMGARNLGLALTALALIAMGLRAGLASLLAAGLIAQVPALPTGLHMPRLRRRSALPLP